MRKKKYGKRITKKKIPLQTLRQAGSNDGKKLQLEGSFCVLSMAEPCFISIQLNLSCFKFTRIKIKLQCIDICFMVKLRIKCNLYNLSTDGGNAPHQLIADVNKLGFHRKLFD